ncbi:MAG: hypothetical protein H0V17_26450 [Deltaproteobacteria bacterium]|nr:hypothetical protein [Deltaproteobacteria bacterium]
MKFAFTIGVVAAISSLSSIAMADRLKVAVVPGIAVNLDSARVDALSQDLADALASELDIDAVGGLEVRRQLPAEGLPPDCLTTPSCVNDVSKRLGASQLVFVVMVDATGSGAVQVDSTWVDVASGKRASRPAIDLPTIADAKTRFAAAAKLVLPDAPVRAKPKLGGGGIGSMSPEIARHMTTPAYVTAGVAVVGVGVGIGFALSARSRYNKCDKPMACSEDEQDSVRTRTVIADLGFLVGIGGIVATSVLYATSGKESRLVVSPTTGGVALSAVGRF